MCGIAGIISLSGRPVAQGRVEAATHALAHRGPDDHGFWYAPDGTVALGQRRLAIIDLSPLGLNETDEAFCRRIVTDYKVAAIPVSAFYEQDAVTSVVRFCFAKKDATLDTALERLHDAVHRR